MGILQFEMVISLSPEAFWGFFFLNVFYCGGLTIAGCQTLTQLLSYFSPSAGDGRRNKMEKRVHRDKKHWFLIVSKQKNFSLTPRLRLNLTLPFLLPLSSPSPHQTVQECGNGGSGLSIPIPLSCSFLLFRAPLLVFSTAGSPSRIDVLQGGFILGYSSC